MSSFQNDEGSQCLISIDLLLTLFLPPYFFSQDLVCPVTDCTVSVWYYARHIVPKVSRAMSPVAADPSRASMIHYSSQPACAALCSSPSHDHRPLGHMATPEALSGGSH